MIAERFRQKNHAKTSLQPLRKNRTVAGCFSFGDILSSWFNYHDYPHSSVIAINRTTQSTASANAPCRALQS